MEEKPRVIGIDPASKHAGIAVVENTELLDSEQLKLDIGKTTEQLAFALSDFKAEIKKWLVKYQPSLLVVENTSVPRNLHTTKILAYFEAVAMIAAAEYKACLIERARTKQARSKVFGRGDISKPEIKTILDKQYGKDFGMDEAEAIVFALYGATLLSVPSQEC